MNKKSILEMARGAILERVDYDMTKVMDNILDPNTKATDKRRITVILDLKPDDDRSRVAVSVSSKCTLAATYPIGTSLYITGDSETGEVCAIEATPQIPGQFGFGGEEQAPPAQLRLIKLA